MNAMFAGVNLYTATMTLESPPGSLTTLMWLRPQHCCLFGCAAQWRLRHRCCQSCRYISHVLLLHMVQVCRGLANPMTCVGCEVIDISADQHDLSEAHLQYAILALYKLPCQLSGQAN